MERIAIVGSGGSGKSTFSQRLGEALDLPVIHLDHLFWHPGWVETPKDEWRRTQEEMVAADRWVIDGNYGGTADIRLARADTVIFLDHSRVVCFWRALTRSVRGYGRAVQAPGCPERIDRDFYAYVWNYPNQGRVRMVGHLRQHGRHARWIWLTSPAQTERWLTALERREVQPSASARI